MEIIYLFFTYFCLLRLPEGVIVPQQPSPSVVLDKLPSVKRVAVIPPRELAHTDPRVSEMLQSLYTVTGTGKRPPKVSVPKESKSRFDKLQSTTLPPPRRKSAYSDTQLRQVGEMVFVSTLRSLAQDRLKAGVPSLEELQKQLMGVNVQGAEDLTPATQQKVADALDCELLLLPQNSTVEVIDRQDRMLTFRVDITAPTYTLGGTKPIGVSRFPIVGTSLSTRSVLAGEYHKSLPEMVAESAVHAAKRTFHVLQANEYPPFLLPNVRFGMAPVASLSTADRLLFTSEGRKTVLKGITALPTEVSGLFVARMPPLYADSFVESRVVKRHLQESGAEASNLWEDSERPKTELVMSLGKALHIDYLLVAHVTDIEAYGSIPTEPFAKQEKGTVGDDDTVFQARAVAFGTLVRVSDGAVLWKDRAESVMSVRYTNLNTLRPVTERSVIQNSIRFALAGLERSFTRYGANFER